MSLYIDAGWDNYTSKPDMLINAYNHSLTILGAYDAEKLVGVIRVVGDGHSIIYIQDVIVLRNYQGSGIDKRLIQEILDKFSYVYQKILLTDNQPKTIAFYQSLGFKTSNEFHCLSFVQFAR